MSPESGKLFTTSLGTKLKYLKLFSYQQTWMKRYRTYKKYFKDLIENSRQHNAASTKGSWNTTTCLNGSRAEYETLSQESFELF